MPIKINLTQDEIKASQSTLPPALAAGTYGAIVYDAKFGDSKAGKPMYTIDFKITDGPEGVNRKIRSWYSLAPNALFSTIGLNKAVGFPYPTKDTPAGEFEFADADEYIGQKVNLKIEQEAYQTVDEDENEVTGYRNVVKRVFPYDEDKVSGAEALDAKSNLFL